MSGKVRKAVIPAAGLGTRFLPATKAQPKEMLPIVDTPAIQLVVEEAVAAGVTDVLIITGRHKRALEDHFDRHLELESALAKQEKSDELEQVKELASLAKIHFIRQGEQLGLGHAVLQAREHVGDEAFLLLLGDSVFLPEHNPSKRLLQAFAKKPEASFVLLEQVAREELSRYGVADIESKEESILQLRDLIEKPSADEAPSDLAVAARYILQPEVFELLTRSSPDKSGELQLTSALSSMCQASRMFASVAQGSRYDIGSKVDYLRTTVDFALARDEFRAPMREILERALSKLESS